MVRRCSLPVLALLTGTLLLAGCGDDDRSSRSSRTSTGSGSSGSVSPAGKPAGALKPGDPATTRGPGTPSTTGPVTGRAADGDVDGDGRADTFAIPEPGVLRVRYSGGGQDSVRFQGGDPAFVEHRVLGASDADRDGHSEVFVQVDQGASIGTATVFRYVDRHLRLVTTAGGEQAALAAGGSTGFLSAWACRPAAGPQTPSPSPSKVALAVASGPSASPGRYRLDVSFYRFDQARLVLVSRESAGPAALDGLPALRDEVSGTSGCGQARLTP